MTTIDRATGNDLTLLAAQYLVQGGRSRCIDRHIRKHWPRKARKRYQRAWEASDEALRQRCRKHWERPDAWPW